MPWQKKKNNLNQNLLCNLLLQLLYFIATFAILEVFLVVVVVLCRVVFLSYKYVLGVIIFFKIEIRFQSKCRMFFFVLFEGGQATSRIRPVAQALTAASTCLRLYLAAHLLFDCDNCQLQAIDRQTDRQTDYKYGAAWSGRNFGCGSSHIERAEKFYSLSACVFIYCN